MSRLRSELQRQATEELADAGGEELEAAQAKLALAEARLDLGQS